MRKASLPLLFVLGLTLIIAPMGLGQGVAPNATLNGDFELFIPPEAGQALEGTPADECIGIGHQVLYGTETYQHDLIDENDPDSAMDRDPVEQAKLFSGYGYCVWSQEEGYDYVWLNPAEKAKDDAVQWSEHPDTSPTDFLNNDDDEDREAVIEADPSASGHNMWQAYPNAHEAFTGDFAAFEFDVEAGQINPGALVQISMNPSPLSEQSARTFEPDCRLSFSGDLLLDNLEGDHVSVDPTEARYSSHYDGCPSEQTWEDADDEGRRTILGQLRIVQLSFWSFNRGVSENPECGCAIQIDNVSITNPASLAESAASGNAQINPTLS